MYKVSILVPVYSVEQFIERCARSLFAQTYPDLEFVFVNDCTPDQSVELLQKVMEEYPQRKPTVKIINHEKNRGLAAARNTALDNATGEFICHVDSDDWLELNAVELLVKRQEDTKSDIVSGNMYVHTVTGVETWYEPHYHSKKEMVLAQLPDMREHNVFRRIIRRSLYEDNSIRCIEGCDRAEDRYQMVLLSLVAEKTSNIDDFVYHYETRNSKSITNLFNQDENLKMLDQDLTNWLGIREFFADKEESYVPETTCYVVNCINRLLYLSVKQHARKYYKKAAAVVYDNEDCLALMGWEKEGVDRIIHDFEVKWIKHSCKRLIGFCGWLMKSIR